MKNSVVVLILVLIINIRSSWVVGFPSFFFNSAKSPSNNSYEENGELQRDGKVLNFISLPDPQACLSNDNRRTGVCQNPYECRMLNGESRGPCALGFGVCCVYTATCGGKLVNNVGYFNSPGYPEAMNPGSKDLTEECIFKVHKSAPEISQIRLDMEHFTIGQPNRKTGVCNQDRFVLRANNAAVRRRQLRMCGINTGQHFYFDVEDVEDSVEIVINMAQEHISRFWEIKITQLEMKDRAPAGCLQYHTDQKGVLQTMNFAENGRHLADQDYNICIKQSESMCSITYEPCDKNSFKIGPATPLGGMMGNFGSIFNPAVNPNTPNQFPPQFVAAGDQGGGLLGEPQPVEVEDDPDGGSGGGGFNIFSLFGGGGREARQYSLLRECNDRIVMPCDSEDLIPVTQGGPGVCDLLHCGNSFCAPEDVETGGPGPAKCKIESSTLPFNIAVHFGPGYREENPEDNLGMCLKYVQQPCS